MKYIAETAALVAALSATAAQAAPAPDYKLFNGPGLPPLTNTRWPVYSLGRGGEKRDASPAAQRAWWRVPLYYGSSGTQKREAFIDNQPKVIPHPGGLKAQLEEYRRLYPELQERDAQGFGLEDFLGLPDTSVNPNFGNTGTFEKKRSANPFVENQPKVVHDPNFNLQEYLRLRNVRGKLLQQREANGITERQPQGVSNPFPWTEIQNRFPGIFQRSAEILPFPGPLGRQDWLPTGSLPDTNGPIYSGGYRGGKERWQRDLNSLLGLATKRNAEAEPFLADIAKLVGMGIDKAVGKRDATADPFLADIAKLVGMGIDKAVGKRDAAADPFLADIAKLVGMGIDKAVGKRDAAADPFLADIAKLVGMGIDKAVGKREAAADPFLADIAKLVGKIIDTAT